ncbi:MAG: hypothetical protein ACKV2U_10855 [Bryobacteraceae bacterium]
MRRGACFTLLLIVGLARQSAWCQPPPDALDSSTVIGAWFHRVEFGELAGAQYVPEENRFFLYATREGPMSMLYRDHVAQLARGALETDDFGFSLDFTRRGTEAFQGHDILDCRRFADTLLANSHPYAQALRKRLNRDADLEALRQADPAKPPKSARARLAAFLNQARQMDDLWPLLNAEISPEAKELLDNPPRGRERKQILGRFLLEDFFRNSVLRRDLNDAYKIVYKPLANSPVVTAILSGSRTEHTLLTADYWLKRLGGGYGVPSDLFYGPSELGLCISAAREQARKGQPIALGEYVNFFALETTYEADGGLPGLALWFRNPRIVVRAGGVDDGPPPPCAERFAASLTRHVPNLMNYPGELGVEMRMLKGLLVLNRAMNFMASVTPADLHKIRRVPAERFENKPPRVIPVPIMFAEQGQAHGLIISGGVKFERSAAKKQPQGSDVRSAAPAGSQATREEDAPGFLTTKITVGGRQLLQIDISSILGLVPK